MKQPTGVNIVTAFVLVGTVLLTSVVVKGQSVAAPKLPGKYDLVKVENMKGFVGSAAARKLLTRNGFVVTSQQFKQIFSAYIGSGPPKFITTDSAWHTYHVLLEEGVKQLEEAQAKRLRKFSRKLVDAATKRVKSGETGFGDLADFASVGLAFQDASFLKTLPKEQAGLVQALRSGSNLVAAPIGFPLMPQRFRAKSFYTKSSELTNYFAARQWYAVVDFRLKSDRETALAAKLAILIDGDPKLSKLWVQLSEPYDALLAKAEDGNVKSYAAAAKKVLGKQPIPSAIDKNVGAIRKELSGQLIDPKVNDQILTPSQYGDFQAEIKGFRLLPPRRLPSAVCFQNTVDPKIKDRMFPSGLDFLASCKTLQSPAARRALKDLSGKDVAEAVLKADCGKVPDSLHGEALKLVALLQKPLPKQTAAALRTDAWADKQLWTQLGAWAEQRHTWALHTKLTVHYLGLTREPAGMVSPYPEFFEGLGRLARATEKAFGKARVGKDFDIRKTAKDLLYHIRLFNRFQELTKKSLDSATEKEIEKLKAEEMKLERLFAFVQKYAEESKIEIGEISQVNSIVQGIEKLARKCAATGKASEKEVKVLKLFAHLTDEVPDLLSQFADMCDNLARIARMHLAGKNLTEADERFIKGYGIALAKFHFYGGNSWLNPRDDFPIVTPIFVSPIGNQSEILYAGLARPQALYVIAPAGGKLHLFRGAVMSYREFRGPISKPLDDAAWTSRVKKGKVPPPPKFTRSFRASITAAEVIEMLRAGRIYAGIDNVSDREITRVMIELIEKGGFPEESWLVKHLCPRCTERDVGDLIRLIGKLSWERTDDFALTVSNLPWKAHRGALMKMLRDKNPQRADAAAYILSRRPDDIDYKQLLTGFDKQPVRTRRLYCFLFGCARKPDDGVKKTLLKALAGKDAGLRWQAAKAIGKLRPTDAGIVKALIVRIDDPNEFVASEAVKSLAKMKATAAAPAMLARLARGVRPRNISDNKSYKQKQAVVGVRRSGTDALMVISPHDHFGPTALGEALVEALGTLAHKPARKQLEKMLTGNYGREAIEALRQIDPKHHVDRLVTRALNQKADSLGREEALDRLCEVRSAGVAARLLPLLKETTVLGGTYNDKEWRVCDQAAKTIASLLGWKDSISKFSEMPERKKLIDKIQKWAGSREASNR